MKSDVVQTLRTRYFRQIFTLTLLAILPVLAKAERLPIKTYTTADGLAHNVINKIVRDSRGFLWFCTADGLSRFDGYSFTNYGTEQGLPLSIVNDILETREGEYWVATNGGLVRFNPQGTPKNQVVGANEVSTTTAPMFALVVPEDTDRHARFITALLEDSNRHIWCGTYKGLYRLDVLSGRLALTPVEIGMPNDYSEQRYINDIAEDAYGSIWIATPHGLYRRWPNGDAARYTTRDGMPADFIHDLLIDHERRLWVSTRTAGFLRLAFDQSHAKPSIAFTVVPRDLGQSDWINQLFETSEHKLWAATAHGLLEVFPNGNEDGTDYRLYTTTYGLSDHDISALGEDAGGNLWLGSANGTGLMRLAHNGFVTYGEPDGLACVNAIFGDRAGGVCFRGFVVGDKRSTVFEHRQTGLMSEANYFMRFGRFDGQRLTWFLPDVMKNFQGWVNEGVTLQSRTGEWWTANGLFHFPAIDNFMQLQRARPLEYFGEKSLLGPRQIWRLFEDSRDRIWVSIIFPIGNGLARWEPDSKSLHDLAPATNLPSLHDDLARSFEEDRAGNVWIGFNTGVARARGEQFAFFTTSDGLAAGGIQTLYTDHAGRLWLGSSRGGLSRMNDPNADQPHFINYTTAEGLSSNAIDVITEDLHGHIYLGTGRGLDELDPTTGRVKHFTTDDGLAPGGFLSAFCDRNGTLWFGTSKGLSRFKPAAAEKPTAPPAILITGLRVGGSTHIVSALGENQINLPNLAANQNEVQIDFVGLNFSLGNVLHYQYKLAGSDAGWSAPTEQRSVNYANLAPRNYQFLVRAVNSDGVTSTTPAMITFTVLPHIWQRWWFILSMLAIAGLMVVVFYRYRVAQLVELERVRTRIATDLHDDIGSGLSRVAIMTEVVKRQVTGTSDESIPMLTEIADSARSLVESMRDIVWAIAPRHEELSNLISRVRQFASDVLEAKEIEWEFQIPAEVEKIKLNPEQRRDLFLIFKEAINNIAQYADCRNVWLSLAVANDQLAAEIRDNGQGIQSISSTPTSRNGHGLDNIRKRAAQIGGVVNISSAAGQGTRITISIPLNKR